MQLWNIYNRTDHRTNNYCESWHSKFIRRTRTTHPNIFRFIDFITEYHNEQIDDIDIIESEQDTGFKYSKKYIKLREEIRIARNKYEKGFISDEQLLNAASF